MKKLLECYSKQILLTVFILALILSTSIKFFVVGGYNFPFTMDQGRDMVDIRQMVVSHTPRLVGPTTSINGVLLGPFWYYFLLPPFLVSGGNPQAIMNWQIIWYQISAIILWFVIKKKDYLLATIIAVLYLLMPIGFNTGRYFWNANAMPIFTAIFFATLIWTLNKINAKRLITLGLIAGLSMQIEAAFGILFFPFALLIIMTKREKWRELLHLIFGFFITLLPQAIFELRHGFIMTKILVSEFSGKGEMLGAKISLGERLSQRFAQYLEMLRFSSHLSPNIVAILFIFGSILSLIYLVKSKKESIVKDISLISVSFLLFSIIFYLFFPQGLKGWYLYGISVDLIIIIGIGLYSLVNSKNLLVKTVGVYFLATSLLYSYYSQVDFIQKVTLLPSNDRSNLRNELADIDWVYQNANGKGFKAYNYLPSVYDYPYHFLYWWYGTKKFGYQPAEVAYLPNQPEYIKDNNIIWTKTKPVGTDNLTFLIVEKDMDMPSREAAWMGNFSKLCKVKESGYYWTARTIMLQSKCD